MFYNQTFRGKIRPGREGLTVFGLAVEELLILVGVAVALVVLLLVLRTLLKLTRAFLKFGCLGIVVLLAIAFVLMRGLGG
jgi:hypothetical protein